MGLLIISFLPCAISSACLQTHATIQFYLWFIIFLSSQLTASPSSIPPKSDTKDPSVASHGCWLVWSGLSFRGQGLIDPQGERGLREGPWRRCPVDVPRTRSAFCVFFPSGFQLSTTAASREFATFRFFLGHGHHGIHFCTVNNSEALF